MLIVEVEGLSVQVVCREEKLCQEAEKLEIGSLVRVTGTLVMESWERKKEPKRERLVVEAESCKLASLPNHGRLGTYTGDVP